MRLERKMIGLVLQGGGGQGGYHIGVWQALNELGIEIGGVTGTSVGALNGAFIAQGDFQRAYDIWQNMNPGMVFKDDPEVYHELTSRKYKIDNHKAYYDYVKKIIEKKGLDIQPLMDLIDREISEDKLRKSKVEFGLVTVSLTDWKAIEIFIEDIEEGHVKDYMLASSYLPGFKKQMIMGKRFIDGGFYDNLPINLISDKGYKEIVAVELAAPGKIRPVKEKGLNIRRIAPSGDVGGLMVFDQETSRKNIKMGYLDTMHAYGKYEGVFYFLTEMPDEVYFYNEILALTDSQIKEMAAIIGYKSGYTKRLLHELIVPELADMLGMTIESTYKDLMVGVVEFMAATLEIERLKVYRYEELRALVIEACKNYKPGWLDIEDMPDMLMRQAIVRKGFVTDLLVRWMTISNPLE